MGKLTDDMKRVVDEQRLAFVATVNEDGTPNLSPKGTIAVLDDDHVMFADLASPKTIENLRRNANVEINVVDAVIRKGFPVVSPAYDLGATEAETASRWEAYFTGLWAARRSRVEGQA